MWSCSYCLLASVTLGKGLNFFFPCLHFGNNTTYLKRWLYGLDHLRQLSHRVKLLKVPLLMSREGPCPS